MIVGTTVKLCPEVTRIFIKVPSSNSPMICG